MSDFIRSVKILIINQLNTFSLIGYFSVVLIRSDVTV